MCIHLKICMCMYDMVCTIHLYCNSRNDHKTLHGCIIGWTIALSLNNTNETCWPSLLNTSLSVWIYIIILIITLHGCIIGWTMALSLNNTNETCWPDLLTTSLSSMHIYIILHYSIINTGLINTCQSAWIEHCSYMAYQSFEMVVYDNIFIFTDWQCQWIDTLLHYVEAGKPASGGLSCYGTPTKATLRRHVHASTSTLATWGPTRWQQLCRSL